ncbi:type VI secretion protein VasK [Pseudomonas silesiensis]|uniref:Type VI secretion protein VasK n=1 Tax=Pseudomonas silesiensis TaxID=1853130 RepID=A0A191YRP9_9PSED|nr:ImcF-related family protein [Pseudomonas silesiensis]ANJ55562.1 type VI secretion protein VasK [Pseudomonas silesiensis]
MQFRHSVGMGVLVGLLLLTGVILGVLVWHDPESLGLAAGSDQQTVWLWVISAATLVVAGVLAGYRLLGLQLGNSAFNRLDADDAVQPAQPASTESPDTRAQPTALVPAYLRERHGPFWRRKIRLLLVVGEPEQIHAIAPQLTQKNWVEGQDTVLIWGGSVQGNVEDAPFKQYLSLNRWRALDGVIWALNKEQSSDAAAMGAGVRYLQTLARHLQWQLPLYLWQVCYSEWPQPQRTTQPVGCLLPARATAVDLETSLDQLILPLRESGWAQIFGDMKHDFLLRLSRDLQAEGIARWRQALAPLFGEFARGLPLRGLWFSLPLPAHKDHAAHHWPIDPAWQGVLEDKAVHSRRLGRHPVRIGSALLMGLALVWGAGMLLSFATQRVQIAQVQTSLVALEQSQTGDAQLLALNDLMRELARLDYRAEHGAPWYQRFGLNQNQNLLEKIQPIYVEANQRLLRDPAVANLQAKLTALIKLPPGSAERAHRAREAYDQLKAYLMLAHPEKTDAAFLTKVLREAEPTRAGISPGVWQGLTPSLWQFYAEHLAAHPEWRIEANPKLVAQARQVLLGQLGQRNAETSLYQQVLEGAANHAPALSLAQMVGDTQAGALFTSKASVPGVFTRQAWEGQVRQAIEAIAEARREEIDWVLSDHPAELDANLTPDVLRARLTQRYFEDYASAWLDFLNRLRWQPAASLGEVIDQLTLMSDVRQSPLIALMNTLAYQGQAGVRGQALAESLMQSAQKLVGQAPVPAIDQTLQGPSGPLDATFGPLLALLGKDAEGGDSDRLSLQAFLNRVTRVRLKLQQVHNAPDPQAMTQALAQSVFQGKNVELTDTQAYGSLLAASLGAEWGQVGETLLVQPLDQAWQRVLQPSAAGLNRQWQRAIVSDWHSAFAGRFPFAATSSDASLPMLGQMIRADSGRIDQFLQQQLGGVLRREGSRWVADPRHSQGLRFNPQFLTAINQLSHLADVLYTDGGMGLSFELRGKAVRDVVQTTFVLNGEKHEYFNQKESWQRFSWPGFSSHPGTSLTWTSVQASERLFGDYEGTWGLIRLLEKARVTPLNDSDSLHRLQLKAPDGLELTWNLRTELGAGPLALLKLRGFTLPQQIFLSENDETVPEAQKRRLK